MNRGVEIASDVADLPRAVITDQVTNGIAVRMSLLYLMLGGDARRAGSESSIEPVQEALPVPLPDAESEEETTAVMPRA
jgi:aspartate carbamoyltransferase catalytic subunit